MVTRERTYWAAIAAGAVALVCLYFFWVAPVRSRVETERAELQKRIDRLDVLNRGSAGIPPANVVKERTAYEAWLDEELRTKVIPFFAELDATLDTPLPNLEGKENISANQFKAAYLTRLDGIQADLQRRSRGLVTAKNLFARYGWAEGADLPSPVDYKTITKDINIRRALLYLMAGSQVSEIQKFVLSAPQPLQKHEWCERIPVSLAVIVPADWVTELIRSLLQASSQKGPTAVCVGIRKLEIEKLDKPASPVTLSAVLVKMDLDVLDFPDSLR